MNRFSKLGIIGGAALGTLAYVNFRSSSQAQQIPQQPNHPTSSTVVSTPHDPVIKAVCVLHPNDESGVKGTVHFSQVPGKSILIEAEVTGLTDGKHGFHIHEYGDLTKGCETAGGHYNPFQHSHGSPEDTERHVGDLGNVISKNGKATFRTFDPLIQLAGQFSVIGRSVVVHTDEDDLGRGGFPDSKTTGHAGGRKACGVIGLTKP